MIRRPEAGMQAGEQVVSFTCHVTMKFMRRSQKILSCIARVRRELELEPLQSRSFIQEIRDTNDVAARGA